MSTAAIRPFRSLTEEGRLDNLGTARCGLRSARGKHQWAKKCKRHKDYVTKPSVRCVQVLRCYGGFNPESKTARHDPFPQAGHAAN
jgi:hypothetical protein